METKRVLITVMTYPHPSKKYRESVCTAGITEDGEWIRLYPIDYRDLKPHNKFRKYQWIEVGLIPRDKNNDKRPESYKPILDSIKLLGEPLDSKRKWGKRRNVVSRVPVHTLLECQRLFEEKSMSLSLVKPSKVLDITIEDSDPDWKDDWKNLIEQGSLFSDYAPLQKINKSFRYIFECEDSDKPHKAMILDWELGVLYLKERERLKSDDLAAESVKNMFLNTMCADDKDVYFFMGTKHPFNTWMVLGVFWPPQTDAYQVDLFARL